MDHVKIQINSLEALERLLGGDSQLEMDIRQSVVEAFTKKHLKTLAQEVTYDRLAKAVADEIGANLLEERKIGHYSPYKLTPQAVKLISEEAETAVKNKVFGAVVEAIDRTGVLNSIDQLLLKQAALIAGQLSEKVLSEKLDKLVNEKIKERLGLK